MPNHFHLLVRRGPQPLHWFMHRLMTGYAVSFNLRHERVGHLFQNRYKALTCATSEHLMSLLPYVHLNPLRAGIVPDLEALADYRWCGHSAIVRGTSDGIVNRRELYRTFGVDIPGLYSFYAENSDTHAEHPGIYEKNFSGSFHDDKNCGLVPETVGSPLVSNRARQDLDRILREVCLKTGVSADDILGPERGRNISAARALYCYLGRAQGGSSVLKLSEILKVSKSAVSRLFLRGKLLLAASLN